LLRAVADGGFRQDLYYRLSVFPLRVPSLRERCEDIPLLVHYFVGRYAARIGRKITRVAHEAMKRLVAYPWPGNIRELENVIERAVILSAGPELEVAAEALPVISETAPGRGLGLTQDRPLVKDSTGWVGDEPLTLEEIERRHIVEVLNRTTWKIDGPNGAAGFLKLNPSTLRSRIKKLGIRRSSDIS
jgi:transcriptional regulator with GAF, ATPase, and Fis domain